MTFIFSNNAATTLAVAINDTATTLTVLDATLFPSSASLTTPCKVTLQDADTGAIEICDCTDITGNVLTVIRGRESTTAISFPIGAIVHHRLTAENLSNFVQDLENVGTGEGEVAQGRVGSAARFKTIKAGSNATVVNNADDVTVNSDGTDLGNTPGPSDVTITSSTGGDTVIVGAVSGAAGVMTGAQVDTLATRIAATDVTYENLDANGDVGPAAGQVEPGLDLPAQDGYVLSSTTAGVRSWVEQSGGGGDARGNIPTGLYTGGEVTISATVGSVDVAAGTGIIVDAMTDPANPAYTEVSWGAQTVDITTPPDNEVTIVINSAGLVELDFGGLQHDEPLFSPQTREKIALAIATCVAGTVTSVVPYSYAVNLGHHTFYDYYSASGGAFLPDPHKDQFLSPENNRVIKFYGEDPGVNRFFTLNGRGRGDNFYDIVGHPLSGELTYWQMFDRYGVFYDSPGPQIDVARYAPFGGRVPIPAPATAASIIMLYHAPGVGMYAEYAYDYYDTLDEACLDLAKYTRSYQSGRYRPVDNWLLVGALIARKDANDLRDTNQARLYPFERNNFRSPFFVKSTTLIDEPTPSLGGNLETKGYDIILQDASSNERGRIISVGTSNSVVFGFIADPTGGIDPTSDGAVFAKAGELTLTGSITEITNLAGQGTVQVYASDDGVLYGVEPPATGWERSDTDTADYTFPTLATWVEIADLFITVPQNVDVGDRIDAAINLYFINSSPTEGGVLDVGIGIDGAVPTTAANSIIIPGGFAGPVATSVTTTNHGGVTAGQVASVFVRRTAEDDPAFGPNLLGSTDPSELIVSVPSAGGGGGSPTDLGNTPGAASVTITSSTGANTVLAGATTGPNGAGVMTEAQVVSLNSKIDATGVTYENLDANGDVGVGATQVAQGDHLHPGVYEPVLGSPSVDGHVLSSTIAGVRSWVPQSGGSSEAVTIPVKVQVARLVQAGSGVRISGWDATAGKLLVEGADIASAGAMPVIGFALTTETAGVEFDLPIYGTFDYDTQTPGWAAGDRLYQGNLGSVLTSPPNINGQENQEIARVLTVAVAGKIFVNPDSGGVFQSPGGIPEAPDVAFGYVREGAPNSTWVRGARVFEAATEPTGMAIGDWWIET